MKAGLSTGLRVAAWSASSLLAVGAVAGTASAATHNNAKSTTAKNNATGDGGPGARPQMLHGTETVETDDGSFETYVSQGGTVSAVSATSITVVSADKYSGTYAIDDSTVVVKDGTKVAAGDVATGDTVMVRGEQEDDAVTAQAILDGKPPAGGPAGHPGPGGPGHGGPPPASAGGEGAGS